MTISRKPVAFPSSGAEPSRPAPPTRKDSWEVYSDDEDEDDNDRRDLPSSKTNAGPNAAPSTTSNPFGGNQYQTQQPDGASAQSAQAQAQANQSEHWDSVPAALRPGGDRAQTNPFLRKKVSQNTSTTPIAQLSKLTTSDVTSGSPLRRAPTNSSSNYGTPPATDISDTSPWTGDALAQAYSPASETAVFPINPREMIPETSHVQSPLHQEDNPWSEPAPSAPQAPTQPPPPPPPEAETNPWASATATPAKQPSPAPLPSFLEPPGPPPSSSPSGSQTSKTPSFTEPPRPPPNFQAPQPTELPAFSSPPVPPAAPAGPVSPHPPAAGYADTNPFHRSTPSPQPPLSQGHSPALMSVPSDDDNAWVDAGQDRNKTPQLLPEAVAVSETAPQLPEVVGVSSGATSDNNIWEGLDALDRPDKGKSKASDSQIDEWNLVDVGEPSGNTGGSRNETADQDERPSLPPRRASGEEAQWASPRPPVDAKTETYQVKKIKWNDANSTQNPRTSPILVQNANGPCPLVALVNALSMTTPPDVNETSLVEVLRTREQISLNLLLDAVFEELMSPRRTDSEVALPDVGDLYAFLMSLHTGMNVNPRFMPTAAIRDAYERTSLTHLNATDRANLIPGTFENTHEMGLYATFKIPLIHGWLPPTSDPVYNALERQAQTYEDAQNLLFHEEELEQKLSNTSDGLSSQEQQLYQDIMTIKHFLNSSATQLTSWGIQVISKAIRPGTFAILFRNDHFSTLYCHPQSKELVTLVTDDGYRSHDEVVWESLVDINGERTQYLSGDFKVVGSGSSTTFEGYSGDQSGEWTTVEGRRGKNREQSEEAPISAREQEDRDLALALQMQEEEDQRHREDQARRQREQNLSNQYIEQQGRQPHGIANSGSRAPGSVAPASVAPNPNSIAPARGSSNQINVPVTGPQQRTSPRQPVQQIRPMVPPRRYNPPATNRPGSGSGDAPPSYEQAAHDEPFNPPAGHPAHATSSNTPSVQSSTPSLPARPGQRPPGMSAHRPSASGSGGRDRDRDCVVM